MGFNLHDYYDFQPNIICAYTYATHVTTKIIEWLWALIIDLLLSVCWVADKVIWQMHFTFLTFYSLPTLITNSTYAIQTLSK